MFKVISARGCYSHHLVNTLAAATNATQVNRFFELSTAGDSHAIRENTEISNMFEMQHFKHLMTPPLLNDRYILIEPDRNHILDYLDNSFSKESKYDFDDWFRERMINRELIPESYFAEILDFFADNDVRIGNARQLAPENAVWMVREMLSFYIDHIMFSCYERYFLLTYHTKIKTTDFFQNFSQAFVELVNTLGLTLTMPLEQVVEHNCNFVSRQQFNNIQIYCNQYVDAAITGMSMSCPCISLFDEAYVQSQLRHRGWEIKVDGLNTLPDAAELHTMLYPAHLKDR